MSAILVGGMILLLAVGVEIAVALGVMAVVGILFFLQQAPDTLISLSWNTMNSFTFTAVPLFVFMGTMFANTGVMRSLFDGAERLIGNLPGGLAVVTIGANAIFGAMSGSSIAAVATFGKIVYPEMERKGYDPKLALGSVAMGGGLSVLIPPSLVLIVYGGYQNVSVVRLFAGALIPGIILALLYVVTIIVWVKINPRLSPKPPQFTWRQRLSGIRDLLPWVGIAVLVLGVIFGGIMTPTEAAALGAFIAIVMALAYRQMSYAALRDSALSAATVSAMVAFVIVMARVFGYVFQYLGVTAMFSTFITGLGWGVYGTLIVIFITYVVLGCFLEGLSIMLITLPFVVPIISHLGLSLVWFGVTFVVIDELGLVTPPFGLNLFALHGVVPKHSILTIAAGTIPFFPAVIALIALVTAFPQVILWFPSITG